MKNKTTYLLHIELPDGEITHYLGSSRSDRLAQRLKEHRGGSGTPRTIAYHKLGARMEIAQLFPYSDEQVERAISHSPVLRTLCRICDPQNRFQLLPDFPKQRKRRARQDPPPASLAQKKGVAASDPQEETARYQCTEIEPKKKTGSPDQAAPASLAHRGSHGLLR